MAFYAFRSGLCVFVFGFLSSFEEREIERERERERERESEREKIERERELVSIRISLMQCVLRAGT